MVKNINKTTVIIVLALFLTISVGYALFSDTITIEGTAPAKGTFDIEPMRYVEIPKNIKESISQDWTEAGNSNAVCSIKDNTISYSVSLDYPLAKKYFVFQFKNTGTISASLPISFMQQLSANTINVYNSETKDLVETIELTEEDENNLFLSL